MSPTQRTCSGRSLLWFAFLFSGTISSPAHLCGPSRIELRAGETCPWRITADRFEVDSDYAPTLAGPDGVCAVLPQKPFKARHGDFIINGLAPGTNTLTVNWAYAGTGASGRCVVTIVVHPAGGVGQQTAVQEGNLSTTYGNAISAERLKALLDFYIPTNSAKLFVLTECFGGNIAFSSYFRNLANLAIASATSPNQYGLYGGYHDDAARALRPGSGRTAFDVHETAVLGKDLLAPPAVFGSPDHSKSNYFNNSEFPRFAGGMNLADFSLEPITATSAVKSRHIIVYMGDPGTGTNKVQEIGGITMPSPLGSTTPIVDTADRDAVKANFAGQANTTVHTVGGVQPASGGLSGVNGWDYRGDFYGLRQAFHDVQSLITNSANPAAEQFILFVGDHGGRGVVAPAATTPVAAPASTTGIISNFRPLSLDDPALGQMLSDLDNIPGFQFSMSGQPPPPVPAPPAVAAAGTSPFDAGAMALEVSAPGLAPLLLPHFNVELIDIDNNGVIGNVAGETYDVFFPAPERELMAFLKSEGISLALVNRSTLPVRIDRIAFVTGSIARPDDSVPAPRIELVRLNAAEQLEITVAAVPGFPYQLQRSTDLRTWTVVRELTFREDTTVLTEPAPASGSLFFRLKSVDF